VTRFRDRSGGLVHVSYCTNVHPAEDLGGVIAQLHRFAAPLQTALATTRLGVGLWLAAPLAADLRNRPEDLALLRGTLDELGLEVVTMNGFPYKAFQAPVVKRDVYRPDWTTDERADYTLTLAWLLARLLPEDVVDGSISTLPLGWRTGWTEEHTDAAQRQLQRVIDGLQRLAEETGRQVRLALEPEPGCIVETTDQAIAALSGLDPEWIGLCLDACHLAVQFERPSEALAALTAGGVPIVKAQVSAALQTPGADHDGLTEFVEPRFLHQTRACVAGSLTGVDDLDEALAGGLPADGEWRVHFHVPVHVDDGRTTQPDLHSLLSDMLGGEQPVTRHLELETYTWDVLPEQLRPRDDAMLVEGLARELGWLTGELSDLGLEAVA
jgi:sugar phosphate isomerase/epimerase